MEDKANNSVPMAVPPGYPGPQPQYGYPQYAPGMAPYPAPQAFPGGPAQPPYAYGAPTPYGQPGPQTVWMPDPPRIPNCPPGLEYLSQIDQILIHQQIELLEIITGFETANKYEIKNSMGQRVYFAAEDNDCCTLNCCGPARPFTMKIMDNMGREVINLNRPLRCSSCCFPCCLQEVNHLLLHDSFGKANLRSSKYQILIWDTANKICFFSSYTGFLFAFKPLSYVS